MRHVYFITCIIISYAILNLGKDTPQSFTYALFSTFALFLAIFSITIFRVPKLYKMTCSRRVSKFDISLYASAILMIIVIQITLTTNSLSIIQKGDKGDTSSFFTLYSSKETSKSPASQENNQPNNWLFGDNLQRNIPLNSNHQLSDKPEIFLELATATDNKHLLESGVYLHSFSLSRFNGDGWSAIPFKEETMTQPILFKESNAKKRIKHRIYQPEKLTSNNIFSSLQGKVSTDALTLKKINPDIYLLAESSKKLNRYQYEASSSPINFEELSNETLIADQGAIYELELPPNLANKLINTCQQNFNQEQLYDQLTSIQQYFEKNYTYSLQTSNKNGDNPIHNFLYEERKGYCEHFATAAALFCRAIGIPSRVSYGWAGGKFYSKDNIFVFCGKDAHAWTEIKLKGYGWIIFDATPADQNAIMDPQQASSNEHAPKLNSLNEKQVSTKEDPALLLSLRDIAISTATILIPAALCFTLILLRKSKILTNNKQSPDYKTSSYIKKFHATCHMLGYEEKAGDTLKQQIDLLRQVKLEPPCADKLLAYHYGVIYEKAKKDQREEQTLFDDINTWSESVTQH